MQRMYLVIPCYNEEEVLPETARRLREKLDSLIEKEQVSEDSRILFVDDGSKDKTWQMISDLCEGDPHFVGVKLAHNRGHQFALLAGLMEARHCCDFAISMDADLQDDIDAVDRMVEDYLAGSDIVYGVRSARTTDTFFKRTTAQGYYKVMQKMGVQLVYNHADYRLMSRRALDALAEYREANLFLRGIVPLIGYRHSVVTYERGERFAGESKYPLKKMLALAWEGITSFSVRPIRWVTGLGVLTAVLGGLGLLAVLILLCCGVAGLGLPAVFAGLWLLGGLQLIGIGIVGEYVGKTYLETKQRPRYRIEEVRNQEKHPL